MIHELAASEAPVSKPELGKVAVGDRLLVFPARYGRGQVEPVEATVTKVGRVWIELERSDGNGYRATTWRLRLDTQDNGGNSSYRDRFLTAEQYAWEQRGRAVDAALFDAGISLNSTTPWREPDRRAALADFIRQYDGLDPI